MLLKNELSIKELEALTGIKAHTIRIWEQRYNIMEPARTDTNIRTYTNQDLKMLLNIAFLNRHGYKISHIAEMSPEERSEKVSQLFELTSDIEPYVDTLTIAMVDLDEHRFEKVITRATIHFGFERMMEYVIYPFLEKIGVMWMTNSVHPAQEHFITNLIRQKLIVAIDSMPLRSGDDGQKFLLFLPEGEIHELSLLYTNYLLKAAGKHVIYLGLNVPLADVKAVAELYHPSHLMTIVTVYPSGKDLQPYLYRLCAEVPDAQVLVSGAQARALPQQLLDQIMVLHDIRQLKKMVSPA